MKNRVTISQCLFFGRAVNESWYKQKKKKNMLEICRINVLFFFFLHFITLLKHLCAITKNH